MSFKAKDLTYDSTQPAFLRRLRGELAGDDSARHERPIPRNKRMKQDDEDDAPTYVLEDNGQSLTKAEYEALLEGKTSKQASKEPETELSKEPEAKDDAKGTRSEGMPPQARIAEAGKLSKKRKAVKIGGNPQDKETPTTQDARAVKKPKKKAKPVKLSFGDQDEG